LNEDGSVEFTSEMPCTLTIQALDFKHADSNDKLLTYISEYNVLFHGYHTHTLITSHCHDICLMFIWQHS